MGLIQTKENLSKEVNKLDLKRFLTEFNILEPASKNSIEKSRTEMDIRIPEDYTDFLMLSNVGEGFIGEQYVILWSVDEIKEANEGYEVQKYLANVILLGTNGGGDGIGVEWTDSKARYISVDLIGMEIDYATNIGTTIFEVMKYWYNNEQ
jgi:hypothetical protein